MNDLDSTLIKLDPKEIPSECEFIIYSLFSIDEVSVIDVDEGKYIVFVLFTWYNHRYWEFQYVCFYELIM